MGSISWVKTTVDISDALFIRAKRHARRTGKPMRALLEEGLRRVLEADVPAEPFVMPDLSVGAEGGSNPLEARSWQDLRDEIYGGK
jgi:hypothetical protein